MNTKRFLTGTIVGGIVLYLVGYLIFSMAFASFYAANTGSATGVDRASEVMWAVVLGAFAYAALICYAMGRRGAMGLAEGFKVGAIVGFLLWVCADFTLYGVENVSNLTRTMVDPLLEVVHGGIGGAAIALVASRADPAP